MRAFGWITVSLLTLFTLCFALGAAMGWTDGAVWEAGISQAGGTITVFAVVVGSLVADLGLPVPSSVVMTASGAVLGVVGGTLANLCGALGAAALGYGLCARFGGDAFRRLVGDDDVRVGAWFDRWGVWAILLSRSVPMLTEIISCLAGLHGIGFGRFMALSAAGTLPIAAVYAWTGAHATGAGGVAVAVLVALVIPAVGYAIMRLIGRD